MLFRSISLAIANDYPQPLQIKGLSVAAKAVVVQDEGERQHAISILLQRYPEYKVMPRPDPAAVPMLRITPEIVSILDYSKGFGHSDLIAFSERDLDLHVGSRTHRWEGSTPPE